MTLSFFAGQLYFGHKLVNSYGIMGDAFAKTHGMAKQKFRPTRLGGFSGAKAYIRYVEVLKKHRNAVGRTFCAAIMGFCRDGQCNAALPSGQGGIAPGLPAPVRAEAGGIFPAIFF
jgi:hypothetical protein